MTEKREILHRLGEEELLLPALVNAALRANDGSNIFLPSSRLQGAMQITRAKAIRISGQSVSQSGLPIPISTRLSGGRREPDKRGMQSRSPPLSLRRYQLP